VNEFMNEITENQKNWGSTMFGQDQGEFVFAHKDSNPKIELEGLATRVYKEEKEKELLSPSAAFSEGAGNRSKVEEADEFRTCFERDRDRIKHSKVFRRLAGKTQVFIFPEDHQRTRLTHALEVAQIALSIASNLNLNSTLAETIALGHDCGHGPGGHASEDAFDEFLEDGFNHAIWGAEVSLRRLNLCSETIDGIRNHSWSLPSPKTLEGEVVSWADRIAYVCHDFEDAVFAGIVSYEDLPKIVIENAGRTRAAQINSFIKDITYNSFKQQQISMSKELAVTLGEFRDFNYKNIYLREESLENSAQVVKILRTLTSYYLENPKVLPFDIFQYPKEQIIKETVNFVAGMTDTYAIHMAKKYCGIKGDFFSKNVS
jgi:dGTPase